METGVVPNRLKYSVFLSFRGFDTRTNFCERLYIALNEKQNVRVFRDNEGMEKDELALLCDLRSSLKRPMIPIFYGVNPEDVRKQSGEFRKDFEEKAKSFDEETIQRWKRAMNLVGNIPGYVCT